MITAIEFKELLQKSCTDYEEYCWMNVCLTAGNDPFAGADNSPYDHSVISDLHILKRSYPLFDDRFHMIITGARGMKLFASLQEIIPDGQQLPVGTNVLYIETQGIPPHLNIFRHGKGRYDDPNIMGTMLIGDTPLTVYESIRGTQN